MRERFKCIDLWVSFTSEGVMLIGVPVKVVFKLAVPIDGPTGWNSVRAYTLYDINLMVTP